MYVKKMSDIIMNSEYIYTVCKQTTKHISDLTSDMMETYGIIKKCAVREYPKSWIGRY